jgi:sigma-B regulation protein RsbU (phosphoserine phosphatase)
MPATPPTVPGVDIAFASRRQHYRRRLLRRGVSFKGFCPRLASRLADVAGKGVPAALLMATFSASLRALARLPISLRELLERLNPYVCTQNGGGFSTTFVAELEPVCGCLTYVNGGHNWPVLRRGYSFLARRRVGGVPLGSCLHPVLMWEYGPPGLRHGPHLQRWPHRRGDGQQQDFGEPGMLALLDYACTESATHVLAQLLQSVDSFVGHARQHDDITCMVLRMSAGDSLETVAG